MTAISDRLVEAGFSRWLGVRELPRLDADRQSNVPGLYVVGDLADAPVIKLALRQGDETGAHLASVLGAPSTDTELLDVVIIGAGPAGITAAMALAQRGFSHRVLERDAPFQTIHRFPTGKLIFADPEGVPTAGGLWFEDAPKEELVARWQRTVEEAGLDIVTGEDVTELSGRDGAFVVHTAAGTALRCRKVVLAIGRRGSVRTLGVPGESLDVVQHELSDPRAYEGRRVLVVGGGDSAIEAAAEIADAGGNVVLSYRRAELGRPKPKNRKRIRRLIDSGRIDFRPETEVAEIAEDHVVLVHGGEQVRVETQDVFVLVGTTLPMTLLRRLGLRMESDIDWARWTWVLGFVALVWCYYLVKQKRDFFPLTLPFLDGVHDWFCVPIPWYPTVDGATKVLDGGFWGSLVYTGLIVGFGLAARRRYQGAQQKRRYLSLMGFQLFMLFGIPELIAPLVFAQPYKLYALSVPWPLSLWSLVHGPEAWPWLLLGALTSFVLVPLYVRRNNEKFCSYLCGCGGLAETFGDRWRHLAPRGALARRSEWLGVVVLAAAIPTTGLLLNDMWDLVGTTTWLSQQVQTTGQLEAVEVAEEEGRMRIADAEVRDGELHLHIEKFDWDGQWHDNGWIGRVEVDGETLWPQQVAEGHYVLALADIPAEATSLTVLSSSSALSRPTEFARHYYDLIVDFWLASVLGVAFYPILGNRVWCRFFCPLRAWMEMMAKRFGRLAIRPDEKCISCGECTKYCQMGIDVQGFAQQQVAFDNQTSACIQCGICVEVCPVDCLSLVVKTETDTRIEARGARWGL